MATRSIAETLVPPMSGAGAGDEDPAPGQTVVEHLEDLRRVLIVCLIAWAGTTALAFIFNHALIQLLERPLKLALLHRGPSPFGSTVIVTSPIEGLSIPFKVAVLAGLAGALPIVAWQAFTFVAPGLRRAERRLAGPFIAGSVVCFAVGATFAYLVMPVGLSFLAGFLGTDAVYLPDLNAYLSFFTLVMVVFGVTFEMPVVVSLLGALGVVSSATLRRWRRPAIFSIVAVALVITPGADPFTPALLSTALIVLYELSILIVRHPLHR
ncbi:MAG TPA: twin-arginine translocase subunit TatC [Candidatus Micrarchaeia archaeon]|nr:twin-arginine translocase subunit TatC [Candidatus Micrarchaeia archaeon]